MNCFFRDENWKKGKPFFLFKWIYFVSVSCHYSDRRLNKSTKIANWNTLRQAWQLPTGRSMFKFRSAYVKISFLGLITVLCGLIFGFKEEGKIGMVYHKTSRNLWSRWWEKFIRNQHRDYFWSSFSSTVRSIQTTYFYLVVISWTLEISFHKAVCP